MRYKLLNKLFGWDYIYWHNSADHSLMPCETVKELISKIDMLNAKIDTLK